MSSDRDHRLMREQLGAYALGGLPELERLGVRAHLDGCSSCRAELAEIEPLADDLRTIDLTQLLTVITPPADLGERIQALVAQESEWSKHVPPRTSVETAEATVAARYAASLRPPR